MADEAQQALKAVVEMPNTDADRIIRSLHQENLAVSNKLRKALPQIFEEGRALFDLHLQIVGAVRAAFDLEIESTE